MILNETFTIPPKSNKGKGTNRKKPVPYHRKACSGGFGIGEWGGQDKRMSK